MRRAAPSESRRFPSRPPRSRGSAKTHAAGALPLPATLVAWLVLTAVASGALHADAPPLPSSRFGTVEVAGAPAPAGTEISAWSGGQLVATSPAFAADGVARYLLDVPGDHPDTPEVEGPTEGASFEIRVGGAPAGTSIWQSGTYQPLDLEAGAGPDLAVALTDGVTAASPGETLAFTLTVTNQGPGTAQGATLEVVLPVGTTLVAASDGGVLQAGRVVWPPFALADGANATRTLQLLLAESFPAGQEELATTAEVRHDGATGADPDPTNDQATDVDLLLAAPDLSLTTSDGREQVRPGETLIYRLRVENAGTQGATGVVLADDLPAGAEFFSASHGGVRVGSRVTWPPAALPAGALLERAVTVRLPASLDPAITELVGAASVADDGANGPDLDPADNAATDVDQVLHGADLVVELVSGAGVTIDPQTLAITGEVSVALANQGTIAAPPFDVTVFQDLDGDGALGGGDAVLGTVRQGGLAANASGSLPVPVTGLASFSGERLFAMADSALEVPELDESNNVGDTAATCVTAPTTAPFQPRVELRWPAPGATIAYPRAIDSLSTPLVVQLTDDNGDGLFDERDIPDLVFVTVDLTYLLEPQVALRAIRGDTGAPIFDVNGFFPHPTAPTLLSFSGLAAGDIDHDGKPEILSTTFGPAPVNFLRAYEHTGALKWVSQGYRTHPSPTGLSNRDNPTLGDLDGDGEVEIVVGAHVFDRHGHLRWVGAGGQAFQSSGNSGDRGGAISAVADVDLDGRLEVVTGNTLYRHDGTIVWQSPLPDGYPAVANFDADPEAEIVVVARGTLRLHDTDGTLLWGPVPLPGSDPEAGGAPTVGDFDGDGAPEIGVAGSDAYAVFDTDGTLLWQTPTQDYSSNLTGSTSFDFDGDGRLEIVYRDERRLRVYRGTDGAVLAEWTLSSNTWTEQPVVADVDGDGNAEIVVTSDRAPDVGIPAGERTAGLFVLGDAGDGWVPARPIWNQHAYLPELVRGDSSVPASPEWSWLTHNSFRANVPPPVGAGASPDLTASRLVIDPAALPLLGVSVRIGNGGAVPVGPGLPVAFYEGEPETGALLGVLTLPGRLAAGAFVELTGAFALPAAPTGILTVVADDDGTGAGRERECDEGNNRVSTGYDLASLGLWITLDDGTASVGPGDTVTYAITVHNAFSGTTTGVAVTDALPAHTLFVAASDGGFPAGGMVSWPPFALASGTSAVRTLTLQVDPAIPLGVTSIANTASVTDDGGQGPDPTPANNVAVDVDAVTSVRADAGGPYFGPEGVPLLLDGSGSFDRDGTIVSHLWDLDADGLFDDASGAVVSWLPPGEGLYVVRLRVTDDSGESDVDETTAEIGNEPPVVSAPPFFEGIEGSPLFLAGVTATDPGDELTATVDWGDGTVESVPVVAGTLLGSHVYPDDGSFEVGVCVSDGSAPPVCLAIPALIANAAPEIPESTEFAFDGWVVEEAPGTTTTRWDVSGSGRTVIQRHNGAPAFFVGTLPSYGEYEITLRVADVGDDDYVGLGLGFVPGDRSNPGASYLLLDWKRGFQDGARPGLALSRVFGTPTAAEFWLHTDQAANGPGNGLVELARAATLGQVGWARHTDYRFRVESSATRLRVWVDGTLELDQAGSFPAGRLALYDYSQAGAVFTAHQTALSVVGVEGQEAILRAHFSDPGIADTHTAQVDWGDGHSGPAPIAEEEGWGEVLASHVYLDDGTPEVVVCVTDDDGASACRTIPGFIENLPPSLQLAVGTTGFFVNPVTLDGTSFTDPGVLDQHSATVDWGDGTVEAASVAQGAGAGTISGSHLYLGAGTYLIRLCVDDGDGGTDCQETEVTLVARLLDLAVSKSLSVAEARPGQRVTYTLRVDNLGTLPASGITLVDHLPEPLIFVSASGSGTHAGGTVTWSPGNLNPGGSTTRTLVAEAPAAVPYGAIVTNAAVVTSSPASGPDGNPGNNFASVPLRFSDAVTPIVTLPAAPAGVEGTLLTLTGARWADTTPGEAHTGIVDWGDGTVEPATLVSPTGTGSSMTLRHTYRDDGLFPIEVCVTDAAGNTGCASTVATIANAPPHVVEPGNVHLGGWPKEEYPHSQPASSWVVAANGLSVTQTVNSRPSIYLSPLPAFGTFLEGILRVQSTSDDDFIGFVLGFASGDSENPQAEYILIDWKGNNQSAARRGLAVSRVFGIVSSGELWDHVNYPANGPENGIEELARGATLGEARWFAGRDYHFRFEYQPDTLRIWVDGLLEFDLTGSFPAGNFGFYNFSQGNVQYRGFVLGLSARYEGERFDLQAAFADLGWDDTHQATIDWDDGAVTSGEFSTNEGFGLVVGPHDYFDDGAYSIGVCVEDDDAGLGCGRFPLLVLNLPPVVDAAPDTWAIVGVATTLPLATFTDPGRLDFHVASAEWGDGATTPVQVEEDAGSGTVLGSHRWDSPGTYTVTVCVEDDDGGSGCDALTVEVLTSPPHLTASKTDEAIDRDGDGRVGPGDWILYRIEIANQGAEEATGLVLTDPIPAHTAIVPGSAGPELLIVSEDPVVAEIPRLAPGASVLVQFAVEVVQPLPAGVHEIVNSGVVSSLELPPVPTDDPELPGPADPTRTPVEASPALALTKSATLLDHDGDGVATAGDEIAWTVELTVGGQRSVSGVVISDPIAPPLALVPGSIVTTQGTVVGFDPVLVALDQLAVGDTVTLAFTTALPAELPPGLEEVVNQATVVATEIDTLLSDDPATPAPADPTRVPVYVHPRLSVAAVALPEGDSGTTPVVFELTLDRPAQLPSSVAWSAESWSAVAGEDFLPASGTLTFAPGETSAQIVVEALGDQVVELDESFRLVLASPMFLFLETAEAFATLLNDDSTTLAAADAFAEEGAPLLFVVSSSAPSALPVSVEWATADGTAVGGSDYVAAAGVLVFAPFETSATIAVVTLDDALPEVPETVRLLLANPQGAELPVAEAWGTITDDDPTFLSIGDATVEEGDDGTTVVTLEVVLSVAHTATVTVDYTTVGESATPGVDFLPAAGTLELAPGETVAQIVVEIVGDEEVEEDETFRVELSSAVLAEIADGSGLVTILDDDAVACALECGESLLLPNEPGFCGAAVTLPVPAPQGECGPVVCEPPSGAFFPVGTTVVTCTASTAPVACTLEVTVVDQEPPALATCPADLRVEVPPGALSWPIEFVAPEATDNCPGVTQGCQPEPGSLFPAGTTLVVCSAVDAVGLTASCEFEVAVAPLAIVEIPALDRRMLILLALALAVAALVLLGRRSL